MHLHFIIHELFEAPGAYENWATKHHYTVTYSRVYAGDPLPASIQPIDLLIVMGGPQSPHTTQAECPHFDAAAEMNIIQQYVAAGKAVIGVCLGAQLIGEALGGTVEHSPEKEIGVFPVSLTEAGKQNSKFQHFPSTFASGHWHSDMPGLTPDSTVIAYSEGCPRQIVEFSNLVYGLQCHMEFTPELVELLITHSANDFTTPGTYSYVQKPEQIRNSPYNEMNQLLFGFLDQLVLEYQSIHEKSGDV
ncbi:GMP synthase (glutamine-hydrolysing) [Filimonas lacunae]|uniref:GMP synthase (Glutamine-hydrolysing) n=1 Tax=Filimonas lacunae TaxID=477680 RepID=A0A173MBQ9_9BACT|nr:type 1 glutamine amidotransferase [Filimonas lacunae]BAV04967.1 glutamine amidotransferase, class I [Filimonas lacunae]SIT33717.1 GMP synthase (glutamine-hydrolysing) [Filimonas lacunae]